MRLLPPTNLLRCRALFALVPSFALDQNAGFHETRKHTSASAVISRDGKCVSGNASVENSSVRSACFTPKRASYRAPETRLPSGAGEGI